jgi:ketosteroid isomerase-like protein
MYKTIVASQVRKGYARLGAGEFDVDAIFARDAVFQMMGDHHLGGERRGREEIRAWFEEVFRLFPDLRLEPVEVVVSGWPWNTRVATRFRVSASLDGGGRYENEGMQFLRLRWAKAVEDRLFEDTQVLDEAIEHQRSNRDATAAATSSGASSTK